MAKDKLIFLDNTNNILDFPQGTIDAYKISDDDKSKIVQTLKLFSSKSKDHFANNTILRQIDNDFKHFDFIYLDKYPLPAAFNIKTKRIIINMKTWGNKDVLNIPPSDLYATILYGFVCAYYTVKNLDENDIEILSDFMSSIFIRMFAKKYGLMGSYAGEIPRLRFLVSTYVMVSFMNMPLNRAYIKASHLSKTTKDTFDVNLDDYDLRNGKEFIKCLSDSGVLHGLNTYEFASKIIRSFGPVSLPMFEDGMRFMATIAGSSVLGTSIYPISIERYSPKLYDKTITIISKAIK